MVARLVLGQTTLRGLIARIPFRLRHCRGAGKAARKPSRHTCAQSSEEATRKRGGFFGVHYFSPRLVSAVASAVIIGDFGNAQTDPSDQQIA